MELKNVLRLSKLASKFVKGSEGNVSQLIGDKIYIKSSGAKLSNLKSEDVVSFNLDGEQLSNFEKTGSIETPFHILLYKKFKKKFICHTHPPKTLKILCSSLVEDFATKRYFPEQVVFNKQKSCVVEYACPGDDLTSQIEMDLDYFILKNGFEPNLILLKNHGIISIGDSVEECLTITEICEKSAGLFEGFIKLSDLIELSSDNIVKITNDNKQKIRLHRLNEK
jgi:ribulose-5-phosphate 4-epimerase/fuculose-1-phosphate aldolase